MKTQTLYRSSTDKIVAGVCGGIAERLGISSLLVRILFVLFSHVGTIVYILMWILVPLNPKEKTVKAS